MSEGTEAPDGLDLDISGMAERVTEAMLEAASEKAYTITHQLTRKERANFAKAIRETGWYKENVVEDDRENWESKSNSELVQEYLIHLGMEDV